MNNKEQKDEIVVKGIKNCMPWLLYDQTVQKMISASMIGPRMFFNFLNLILDQKY